MKILQLFFNQSQSATCYLVGSTIIIQMSITIFQVSKNKNYKEYFRTNQTLARVNLNDIRSLN